jgi:hypothetical protein
MHNLEDHTTADPDWDDLLAWLAGHGMDTNLAVRRALRIGQSLSLREANSHIQSQALAMASSQPEPAPVIHLYSPSLLLTS